MHHDKQDMTDKTLFLIAGEASGDYLGGELMRALQEAEPGLRFAGIGGEAMQQQGLASLFPIGELSLMGFVEVLPHLARLKRRIRQTATAILAAQPDALITIDSPGFTFRVVRALRQAGFDKPCVHYVAPTVWAYKPQRAAKTSALFDVLLVLLPFEPPYFEQTGLRTVFTGHPVAWYWKDKGDGPGFRAAHGIAKDAPLLGMMPDSRKGELARHLPVFKQTAIQLLRDMPLLHILMPVTDALRETIAAQVSDWPCPVILHSDRRTKRDAFAACDAALAKSGTVALEVALAGVPCITAFRAHPVSIWMMRRMVKIPYINLVNILAWFEHEAAPIPERIQERCIPGQLAPELRKLLCDESVRQAQLAASRRTLARLGADEPVSPSHKAAQIVLGYIDR